MLRIIAAHGLKLKSKKSFIMMLKIVLLGRIVDQNGSKVDLEKISRIREAKSPISELIFVRL